MKIINHRCLNCIYQVNFWSMGFRKLSFLRSFCKQVCKMGCSQCILGVKSNMAEFWICSMSTGSFLTINCFDLLREWCMLKGLVWGYKSCDSSTAQVKMDFINTFCPCNTTTTLPFHTYKKRYHGNHSFHKKWLHLCGNFGFSITVIKKASWAAWNQVQSHLLLADNMVTIVNISNGQSK